MSWKLCIILCVILIVNKNPRNINIIFGSTSLRQKRQIYSSSKLRRVMHGLNRQLRGEEDKLVSNKRLMGTSLRNDKWISFKSNRDNKAPSHIRRTKWLSTRWKMIAKYKKPIIQSGWKRRISENPPIVYYEKAKTSKRETCLLEDTRNMLQMVVT